MHVCVCECTYTVEVRTVFGSYMHKQAILQKVVHNQAVFFCVIISSSHISHPHSRDPHILHVASS